MKLMSGSRGPDRPLGGIRPPPPTMQLPPIDPRHYAAPAHYKSMRSSAPATRQLYWRPISYRATSR
ncbi:MAG: hypothetical protein KDI82_05590 [Gammaproteobacteria bacterium]|nr:hypothetical protein [Gammaproteobacteria bacterium]